MPSSPFLYHSGFGIISAVAILAIVASFLTLVASVLLLGLYRRRVAQLMLESAGDGEDRTVEAQRSDDLRNSAWRCDAPGPSRVSLAAKGESSDCLYRRTNEEPRRHALKYAIAGFLFASVVGLSSVSALSQTTINYLSAASHPVQFVFMLWTCAWPVVLTTAIVAGGSKLRFVLYFIILFVLGATIALMPTEAAFQAGALMLPAWSGASPLQLAGKWTLFNGAPTLLVVLFRNRWTRAVATLVLSFMSLVSAGVLAIISVAFLYQDVSVAVTVFAAEALGLSIRTALVGYFLLIIAAAAFICGVFGWRVLVWIRNAYQRKLISDQSLTVDALWLIFASFYAVMLAFAGPGWTLSAVVAFAIFQLAVRTGNRMLRQKYENRPKSPALLVLRVFSLGKRSEILFDAVTRHWRYVGNVYLIAGTDLALSTVAPHQFLAFLSGKLDRLFVRGETTLERSLGALDPRRDADGRFRINDFFCHADTWQSVLLRLVKSTDVVMMDLRNFAKKNAGCVFEIKELVQRVPFERLVFIIDATTDKIFLDQVLGESHRELSNDSPNHGVSLSSVQKVDIRSLSNRELQNLLRKLCVAGGHQNRFETSLSGTVSPL